MLITGHLRRELKISISKNDKLEDCENNLTVELMDKYISGIVDQLNLQLKELLITYDNKGNPTYNIADGSNEVASDIEYYTQLEIHFIYHFAIWRLQGIFEGLLSQLFFKNDNITGLKKKLDKIRKLGFKITDNDYEELLDWARLRNSLSHFPSPKYSPIPINRNDIMQYKVLIERIFNELNNQQKLATRANE